MRDLNIAREGPDDDIIDLEDIIEMPAGPIDEDEDLDLDVDVFELDSDLEPEPERPAQRPSQRPARPLTKQQAKGQGSDVEDLLKSFDDEPEEDEELFEPVALKGPRKKSTGRAEPQVSEDEDEESLLDEFMDKPAIANESSEPAASKAAAPTIVPIPPAADLSQVAEELIGRIESRLQQHIQVMVESRLPDLVRSIINEEVEKLKKEF